MTRISQNTVLHKKEVLGLFRTSEDRFLQFLSLIAKVYKKKGPEEECTEAEEDVEEEVRDAAAEDPADTPTNNPPAAEQQREQPEAPVEPPAANTLVRQEATFDLEWSELSEYDDDICDCSQDLFD